MKARPTLIYIYKCNREDKENDFLLYISSFLFQFIQPI